MTDFKKQYEGFQESFMRLAIDLAQKGCGKVNPNPMVGAVIVKEGKVIGQGYHARYGDLHAERAAFASLDNQEDARGADLYVTLEPCCHVGKQPPCTDAIIAHGIQRVFVGSADPNPMVSGKGISILRDHGIVVVEDVLRKECDAFNEVFFHYIQRGTPYVVMKYAMTMDGKIATVSGKSRWITGEEARRKVHESRNRYAAILVGIGTVMKDDPMLNCRLEGGENPVRIVCDSSLRISMDSQLVKSAREIPMWIAAVKPDAIFGTEEDSLGKDSSEQDRFTKSSLEKDSLTKDSLGKDSLEQDLAERNARAQQLTAAGCRILYTDPDENGHVSLRQLMEQLGREKIDSVLLEGGAGIHEAALRSRIVNKVQVYIAPKLFGGRKAPSPVGGDGVDTPAQAWMLTEPSITRLGEDLLLESEVIYPCLQES